MLQRIVLNNFRSYENLVHKFDGNVVFLGPNGAGKTNILEAISVLMPGRGFRGSSYHDMMAKNSGSLVGIDLYKAPTYWSVFGSTDQLNFSTKFESDKRTNYINGEQKGSSVISEHIRYLALEPTQDSMLGESNLIRRRFFDKIVACIDLNHIKDMRSYSHLMMERNQLLKLRSYDHTWMHNIEEQMVHIGKAITRRRTHIVTMLNSTEQRNFPKPILSLNGAFESSDDEIALYLNSRKDDAIRARTSIGPHKTILNIKGVFRNKVIDITECSGGEQKALLLSLIIETARLSSQENIQPPADHIYEEQMTEVGEPSICKRSTYTLLLMDEVTSRLDYNVQQKLFEEIASVKVQAFFTSSSHNISWPSNYQIIKINPL